MILQDVYQHIGPAFIYLHWLLRERKPEESISHKVMPTFEQHCAFVASRPYEAWYLIWEDGDCRGAAYLSKQREIGIGIFLRDRGKGLAERALSELMRLHPGRFLANIAPGNDASLMLFRKLGFGGPIQVTLEKP